MKEGNPVDVLVLNEIQATVSEQQRDENPQRGFSVCWGNLRLKPTLPDQVLELKPSGIAGVYAAVAGASSPGSWVSCAERRVLSSRGSAGIKTGAQFACQRDS